MPHPHLWPALFGAIVGPPLLGWVGWALWRRRRGMSPIVRWLAAAATFLLAAFYTLNIYAWFVEPNLLVVRRIEIASEHWRGAPLTIGVISDTHVAGPHVDAARVGRVVERMNALRPDIVFLLGDYAGGHASEFERSGAEQQQVLGGVATFAALKAPLGVVGVIGNHDVWYGRTSITRAMEEAGVAALWNRNVILARPGGAFAVAGLADADTGEPDLAAALDGLDGLDTIIISHSPDPFAQAGPGAALMLAGHGHCGQVTIPLIGRPILPLRNKRYGCGLIEEGGKIIFVTAGIGTSIVPMRFLNPPEIVLITLRSA